MTRDERIEVAAKALYEARTLAGDIPKSLAKGVPWAVLSDRAKGAFRYLVEPTIDAAYPGLAAGTHWIAPREETEPMWDGLARQIVLWRDMSDRSGSGLYAHLRASGWKIPEWLPALVPDTAHTPPKGAVAGAIYRAARDAYLKQEEGE